MNILALLFRRLRRPVVVNTYSVRKTDYRKAFEAKTAQLAKERGRPNPLRLEQ